MIVRCPQCQYANQVEADATKPRIVCARCATVISLEFLSSPSVPPVSDLAGFDLPVSDSLAEGHPSAAPSIMKTPESPLDLDSLLDLPVETAPLQPFATPSPIAPPVMPASSSPPESRWDTEEILDIPRASAAAEPSHDPLAVEDLLATTPFESDVPDGSAEAVFAEPTPLADSAAAGLWGNSMDDASEIITEPTTAFDESPHAQFATEDYAQAATEFNPEPPPVRPSVFAQDSYTRSPANTYVMATPDSSNKGRLATIFLVAAVFFALVGIGYFALSGLIKDWLGGRQGQQAAVSPGVATTPSVAPSLGTKTGTEANSKNTSSPSAAASGAASVKPASSASPTPAPTKPPAASPPTPTLAPPPTGTSGPAVGAGEGSLTLQLGAYKSAGEAQARVAKLKAAGVEGRVVKAEVPGKGTWYRVQSGRFTNEAEASKQMSGLRAKGVAQDFIITGYQNQ